MKYSVPFLAIIACTLGACQSDAKSEKGFVEKILLPKNEPFSVEKFTLNFKDITVSQGLKVEIYKAESTYVEVEGPKNLANQIDLQVEGVNLVVHCKAGITASAMDEVVVKIFSPNINRIEATNAAEITIKDYFAQENVLIRAISGAAIQGEVVADNLEIDAGSSAEVDMKVQSDNLKIVCSSSSVIKLKGRVDKAYFETSSSALLEAYNLKVTEAEILASSSSTIKSTVEMLLKAVSSSGATVDVVGSRDLRVLQNDANNGSHINIKYN